MHEIKEKYIQSVENKFKNLTPKIANYKTSKTDLYFNTIRRGFLLLQRDKELEYVRKKVIIEKSHSNLDEDLFATSFDNFLDTTNSNNIVYTIKRAFSNINPPNEFKADVNDIIKSLIIYTSTFDDCVNDLHGYASTVGKDSILSSILENIRLYNITKPFVALASNYGVPQNRERVLFIGCRKDQKLIETIPPTVKGNEKVSVFEALYDLDFIGNDEEAPAYKPVDIKAKFNGSSEKLMSLLRKRSIDGKVDEEGKTFADWSKVGRLNGRFLHMKDPVYVHTLEDYRSIDNFPAKQLQNHKTSNENKDVVKRLEVILSHGDYEKANENLKIIGLTYEKRHYNVLNPTWQSPTVMTIPDDYIHYASPRALTVREMARLRSFDDSFVFQGKRTAGKNKPKWKSEFSQMELVINSIPPLLSRAIAKEILKAVM